MYNTLDFAALKALPHVVGGFVFTTDGKTPSSGYSKGKPPWRLHDLRRVAASGMARLGINLPVIEKVLNHASGSFAGSVGVYQRRSFGDEKRAALDAWGSFVADLIHNNKTNKIVCLRRRTR